MELLNAEPALHAVVADDEPIIREMVGDALVRQGFEVEHAANGHQVLYLLKSSSIDLLVSDIRMPGPNGLDVVGTAREISPATSCIIITGDATLETARGATQKGAYDYLPKPFTQEELISAVNSALSRKQRDRARAREHELADLYRLSEDFRDTSDPWEMLHVTSTTAAVQTGSDTGCLASVREGRISPLNVGPMATNEQPNIQVPTELLEEAIERRPPVLFTNETANHPLCDLVAITPVVDIAGVGAPAEVLVFPLRNRDEVLGAFAIARAEQERPYNKGDLQLMSVLSGQCGLLLQNAELIEHLQKAYVGTVHAMARVVEARDKYTHGHSQRVADLCAKLAQKMDVPPDRAELLHLAAGLHDIGKIAVPDGVLNKPGKLTDEEWDSIRAHPAVGAEVLRPAKFLTAAMPLVLHHHERYDGKGYPDGMGHEELPDLAHIIIASDAFDAMTSDRPYRPALSINDALDELEAGMGTQFAPDVVEAMVLVWTDPALTAVPVVR